MFCSSLSLNLHVKPVNFCRSILGPHFAIISFLSISIAGGIKDRQGNVQQFNKEELNMILKFGAEDLFKEGEAGVEAEQEKEVCSITAYYGPLIYTAPYSMRLMRGNPLRVQVGGGWALGNETFLSPMKWHRSAVRGPKKSRFPGPNPLPLAQVMDLPASKALHTGPYPRRINQRSTSTYPTSPLPLTHLFVYRPEQWPVQLNLNHKT